MNNYTELIRETMRDNAMSLIEIMILEKQPFRLILWNNDSWDRPLPKEIMESYPVQIVLDIKEDSLLDSFVEKGEVYIKTFFNEETYIKLLEREEILAILDLSGEPLLINNFTKDIDKIEEVPARVDDLINFAVNHGIPEENIKRSIAAFTKAGTFV